MRKKKKPKKGQTKYNNALDALGVLYAGDSKTTENDRIRYLNTLTVDSVLLREGKKPVTIKESLAFMRRQLTTVSTYGMTEDAMRETRNYYMALSNMYTLVTSYTFRQKPDRRTFMKPFRWLDTEDEEFLRLSGLPKRTCDLFNTLSTRLIEYRINPEATHPEIEANIPRLKRIDNLRKQILASNKDDPKLLKKMMKI